MATAERASLIRERLRERVMRRLPPLLAALALAFAFFTGVTLVFRPPGATAALAALDAAGALALGLAAAWLWRRPAAASRANAIAGTALGFTLLASLVAIKLLRLPAQTTNVMIIELVGSVILLSSGWMGALLVTSLVGWLAVALSEGLTDAWLNAGFGLVVTTVMAGVVQAVRLREANVSESATLATADNAKRLEADITEERERAKSLAGEKDSLEAFTYVVSHDLKEPIRSMRFFLEEARAAEDAAEKDELLDRAIVGHTQLQRLVTGLLEWSRVTTAPLQPEVVRVPELLNDPATRAIFDPVLEERRAKLLIEREMPLVLGTPALVRQVLGNLILNAVKHNERADPHVRVYASPDAPNGFVDIVVEDNGPGFPQATIDSMERLQDLPSTVKGGFGLAIARRAAKRLGGDLHLRNREGEPGARVHVLVPAVIQRREAFNQRVRELV